MLTRKRKREMLEVKETATSKALRQPIILNNIFSHCNFQTLRSCVTVNRLWSIEVIPALWYGDSWGNNVNPSNYVPQGPCVSHLTRMAVPHPERLTEMVQYIKILKLWSAWPPQVGEDDFDLLLTMPVWNNCRPKILEIKNERWLALEKWTLGMLWEGLQMVDLENLLPSGDKVIRELSIRCPSLRWLRLSGVGGIGSDHLIAFLENNKTLEVFDYGTTLSDHVTLGPGAISALGNLPNLRGLRLLKFELSEPGFLADSPWLTKSKFQKLECCALHCRSTDLATLLIAIIEQAPSLQSLHFSGRFTYKKSPIRLMTALSGQHKLEDLMIVIYPKPHLSSGVLYDAISDEELIGLVQSLPNLRRLVWENHGSEFSSLKPLNSKTFAKLVSHMPNIEFFQAKKMHLFPSKQIDCIMAVAMKCPKIRELRLPLEISLYELGRIPSAYQLSCLEQLGLLDFCERNWDSYDGLEDVTVATRNFVRATLLQDISDILDHAMPRLLDLESQRGERTSPFGPYPEGDIWPEVLRSQMAKACQRLPASERHVIGDRSKYNDLVLLGPTDRNFEGWMVKQRVAFFKNLQ